MKLCTWISIKNIFTLLYYLPLGNANVICVTSLFNLKAHITEDVRGFIQKPAIHYKIHSNDETITMDTEGIIHRRDGTKEIVDKENRIEENLINTYHEKVENFINSRKKKISL